MTSITRAETLTEALAAAYKFNPRLDAARATLRATDEEVPRALSGYRPSITGTSDAGYQRVLSKPAQPTDAATNPRGYSVGLVQPLFNGFRTVNAVNGAEATVRAGRETLRNTEQAVLLDAVTFYVDVVRDQEIVRLREAYATALVRDEKNTQERFRAGEVTRTDLSQVQARRLTASAALDLAQASLRTSRANFERVIGHPPSHLVAARETSRIAKTLEENQEVAGRESPTVVGALYREQAARYSIDEIRGELLPTAQLEANYGQRYDLPGSSLPPLIDQQQTTLVTARLSVPFYSGGEVQARVRQAKQTQIQRLQEIEQARTETLAQVVAAWSQLLATRMAVNLDEQAVEVNRTAVTGVRQEERAGQRTVIEVLNAESELLNAQINLATDRHNLVVASYTVLSSIGRLNAQELSLASLIYDPEAHYREVRRQWLDISITHSDGRSETLTATPARGGD